jgi:hypothetical protein
VKVWLFHQSHVTKGALVHHNAQLTYWGRQELVERVKAGTPEATVAEQMNVSRPTVHKWWARYLEDPDGQWWVDRSSRPRRCPTRTRRRVERKIVHLRRIGEARPGPHRRSGRRAGLDHLCGAAPSAAESAVMDGPADR